MTLRTRLVISFTVLLLVAIAAVGAIATTTTRRVLISQIDTALVEVDERLRSVPERRGSLSGSKRTPSRLSEFLRRCLTRRSGPV